MLGAASDKPWLGPLATLAVVVLHLRSAKRKQTALYLLLSVAVLGSAFDQVIVSAGLVEYRGGIPGLLPLWMVGLWLQFATTLNVALRWLRERLVLASMLGLVGGPAAYAAGIRLGATTYIDPTWTLVAASIAWGILTPIVVKLAQKMDGFEGT